MVTDAEPEKLWQLEYNCSKLVLLDIWRNRIIGAVHQAALGFNREWTTGGEFTFRVYGNSSVEARNEWVEGKFGRLHESPRYRLRWGPLIGFGNGFGTAWAGSTYLTSSGPQNLPWIVCVQEPLTGLYIKPITPPFSPLDFPLYNPARSWPSAGC